MVEAVLRLAGLARALGGDDWGRQCRRARARSVPFRARSFPARAIALGVAAVALLAWPGGPAVAAGGLRGEHSLAPLHAALQRLERDQRRVARGSPSQEPPVWMLQLGDSHTAADRLSGRLRELFQERFGAAGRGPLPPGHPYDGFRPGLVTIEQSGGWRIDNSFSADAAGPFGLSGFRAVAQAPAAVLTLTSTEAQGFDRLVIEFLRAPGNGHLTVSVDGLPVQTVDGADVVTRYQVLALAVAPGSQRVTVAPVGDGPVRLLGWGGWRQQAGVIYESHGVVGADAGLFDRWDVETVAAQLQWRRPALIALAYGTNEGFLDDLDLISYRVAFAGRLALLRRLAPQAALLVIGPPDAQRLPAGCRPRAATAACAPTVAGPGGACRWQPPPNLALVRKLQQEVAQAVGALFWDWSRVMGSPCGTHRWARAEPPLAAADHVHLRTEGYRLSAEALFKVLLERYPGFAG